jgi:succinate dehydrogenase / fumarate reductase membrane anchor subunit
MVGETIVRRAAVRKGRQGSLYELYAWFFMRVSGVLLMAVIAAHLAYMHFVINNGGGVATIDHATIVGRWTGPWGTAWRTFDLILLLFSFSHGTNGVRYVLEDYVHSNELRTILKTLLYVVFFVLLVMGSYIIFSFKTTV